MQAIQAGNELAHAQAAQLMQIQATLSTTAQMQATQMAVDADRQATSDAVHRQLIGGRDARHRKRGRGGDDDSPHAVVAAASRSRPPRRRRDLPGHVRATATVAVSCPAPARRRRPACSRLARRWTTTRARAGEPVSRRWSIAAVLAALVALAVGPAHAQTRERAGRPGVAVPAGHGDVGAGAADLRPRHLRPPGRDRAGVGRGRSGVPGR